MFTKEKMKPRYIAVILISIIFFAGIRPAFGAATLNFGGKILTTQIPAVVCNPFLGSAPVLLSSNLAHFAAGAYAGATSDSAVGKAGFFVLSVWSLLPYYTISYTKIPRAGDQILGRYEIVPDFSTCRVPPYFPIPVKKTSNFGVSERDNLR